MSLIDEGPPRSAMVISGWARIHQWRRALHSELLKTTSRRLQRPVSRAFNNKTTASRNAAGAQRQPALAALSPSHREGWITDSGAAQELCVRRGHHLPRTFPGGEARQQGGTGGRCWPGARESAWIRTASSTCRPNVCTNTSAVAERAAIVVLYNRWQDPDWSCSRARFLFAAKPRRIPSGQDHHQVDQQHRQSRNDDPAVAAG